VTENIVPVVVTYRKKNGMQNRNILLLLDHCATHNHESLQVKHIQVL